tara:strand:+ start:1518 stop:1718 length:201 start_codon:yes stop_codon:yes gene_type:complete
MSEAKGAIKMNNADIENAHKAVGGGFKIMKNELIGHDEIIILAGVNAYERLRKAKPEKQLEGGEDV